MHPHLLESLAKQRHRQFMREAQRNQCRRRGRLADIRATANRQRPARSFHLSFFLKMAELLISLGTAMRTWAMVRLGERGCDKPLP